MFKFNLTYVALAAALSSSFVYADPTTYTHLSGAKVIDIENPMPPASHIICIVSLMLIVRVLF